MTTSHAEFSRHGSFAHLPLGRLPSLEKPTQLRLAKYLDEAALPQIPSAFDLTVNVAAWPMYGNDRLGDCTWAAYGHMIQAWTAAEKSEFTPAELAIETGYWETGSPPAATGYAGGATDTGRVETDVLDYCRANMIDGSAALTAYVSVDPQNAAHVAAAIYLFGGLYLGIALPLTAQRQQVWDVVGDGRTGPSEPGSWGGHAVPELAYGPAADLGNYTIVTWGGTLEMTPAFHNAYVEEAYALLSPLWLKAPDGTLESPAGFDLAALQADLAALGA